MLFTLSQLTALEKPPHIGSSIIPSSLSVASTLKGPTMYQSRSLGDNLTLQHPAVWHYIQYSLQSAYIHKIPHHTSERLALQHSDNCHYFVWSPNSTQDSLSNLSHSSMLLTFSMICNQRFIVIPVIIISLLFLFTSDKFITVYPRLFITPLADIQAL